MKIFDRIVVALEALCALGILFFIINIPGTDVDDVLSAVDLDFPNYNIVNTDDMDDLEWGSWSCDLVGTRFSVFRYKITFSQKDSTALVKQLQGKGWEKLKNNWYEKSLDIAGNGSSVIESDLTYYTFVNPKSGTAELYIQIDDDYMFSAWIIIIFLISVAVFIAILWAIVKIFYKIRYRIKYKRWRN